MSRNNLSKKQVAERNENIFSDYQLLKDTGMLKMEIYQLLADRHGIVERNTVSQIIYKQLKANSPKESKGLQKISKKDLLENIKPDQNGNFSLTELWKLSSGDDQKAPAKWQESEPVQRFITTACKILNIGISDIIKSKRGKGGGTYGHRQIFLEYAQYLDSDLAFLVNEVFFERAEEEENPDLILDRAESTYIRKGKSLEWINKRFISKGVRIGFTEVLKKHGVINEGYKNCTNAMYVALYGKTASEIREVKKLPKKANIRENMTELELQAIAFAESLAKQDITDNRRYGNEECSTSSNLAARVVSNSIKQFKNNR